MTIAEPLSIMDFVEIMELYAPVTNAWLNDIAITEY